MPEPMILHLERAERAMAAGMFTYDVTATGAECFEVTASHPVLGTHLIGAFESLAAAEAFAEKMRTVDAGVSHGAADHTVELLVRRNHELLAAAAKVRSEIKKTELMAAQTIARARATCAASKRLWTPSGIRGARRVMPS